MDTPERYAVQATPLSYNDGHVARTWGEGSTALVGATINGRYAVLELIGEGGMGVVFRADQLGTGRNVALKFLHRRLSGNERSVRRFENEARAISLLRHPNTIRLFDFQRTRGGDLFIVTELLSGSSVRRILGELGPLPVDQALWIVDQICGSLAEAHAAGIIHRDLKPENVFVERVGTDEFVKVLDFGIAKIESGDFTQPGVINGTPAYMAPEQAQAFEIDHRADVYALGVLLFEMLTGRPLFSDKSEMIVLQKQVSEPPPRLRSSLPDVAPELDRLVSDMLAKSRDERPKSVNEIRQRLARVRPNAPSSWKAFRTVSEASTSTPMPAAPTPFVLSLPSSENGSRASSDPIAVLPAFGESSEACMPTQELPVRPSSPRLSGASRHRGALMVAIAASCVTLAALVVSRLEFESDPVAAVSDDTAPAPRSPARAPEPVHEAPPVLAPVTPAPATLHPLDAEPTRLDPALAPSPRLDPEPERPPPIDFRRSSPKRAKPKTEPASDKFGGDVLDVEIKRISTPPPSRKRVR